MFGSVFALLPLLLLPASVGRGWRNADRDYLVIPALLVVFTGYIVLVGGDVMPAYRFFSPLVPVMALLAAMTLTTHREEVRTPVVIGCVLFNLMMVLTSVTPSIRGDVVAHNGTVAGRWLRIHAPKGRGVGGEQRAGALVYYSRMRAIDMLGLNDSHIAHRKVEGMGKGHSGHEKGDGAYVLSRRPEFIQLGSSLGWVPTKVMPDPPFPGDRELWNNPEFRSGYHLCTTRAGRRVGRAASAAGCSASTCAMTCSKR
ncbi:MAG: hypothetical protein H6837_12900 [Planctomycetes bacterium]|nr:hypothetical protein [Planctomycetota bacterium]